MAKSLSYYQPSRPNDIFAFRDILSSTPDAFTDLLKFVDIVLTLPVTTASNERVFSTLGRVRNYLRNSCGDERLVSSFLSCLSEDARHRSVETVGRGRELCATKITQISVDALNGC